MNKKIFVCGAIDPEMNVISECISNNSEFSNIAIFLAVDENAELVTTRTAYSCVITPAIDQHLQQGGTVVFVECSPVNRHELEQLYPNGNIVFIDHHRPGDPGFGKPAEEAISASSLGQVLSFLYNGKIIYIKDLNSYYIVDNNCGKLICIPENLTIAAACDHALGAAWSGLIPGITKEMVRNYRAKTAYTRPIDPVSEDEYYSRFENTRKIIDKFMSHNQSERIIDLRKEGHLNELPDVASFLGVGYIQEISDRDGRKKVIIGGCTTPEDVNWFKDTFAVNNGLTGVYGDPIRGFAGGYLK